MNINIKATGMEITEAIRAYVDEKVTTLEKFFPQIIQVNVDVGLESHHHNKGKVYYAEVNMQVPGRVVRVRKNAVNLYKAIDKVRDHFKIELEKNKEKRRRVDRKTGRD